MFLTQILHFNLKRVKIAGGDKEYLKKNSWTEKHIARIQNNENLPIVLVLKELSTSQAVKDLELTPTSISQASRQLESGYSALALIWRMGGMLHAVADYQKQYYKNER